MTQDEALEELASLCVSTSDPVLSDDDLMIALRAGTLADAAGYAPIAVGWTPTYDLNRAAAKGWQMKAGYAAGRFDYRDPSGEVNRSQVVRQCLEMANQFKRSIITVSTR